MPLGDVHASLSYQRLNLFLVRIRSQHVADIVRQGTPELGGKGVYQRAHTASCPVTGFWWQRAKQRPQQPIRSVGKESAHQALPLPMLTASILPQKAPSVKLVKGAVLCYSAHKDPHSQELPA